MSTTNVPVAVADAIDVPVAVEASDIQAIVLRPRPTPYRGEYVIFRVDDASQGREMVRRLTPHVAPADEWWVPSLPGWLGIAFTFEGLKALGLPAASLDSFPIEFRQGMGRAPRSSMTSAPMHRPTGNIPSGRRTCT